MCFMRTIGTVRYRNGGAANVFAVPYAASVLCTCYRSHFALGTFGGMFKRFSNPGQVLGGDVTEYLVVPLARPSPAKTPR